MNFLKMNKHQIGLQVIGNTHIDPTDKILESNLILDFSTGSLDTAIKAINSDLGTLTAKKVAVFGQIVNLAVSTGTSESAPIDTQLASVYPLALAAGGNSGVDGLITDAPFNKVPIKISGSNLPLEMQEGGPDIFGRLVYDSGAVEGSRFTVEFYYMNGAVETVAVLPANATVDILVPMSMNLSAVPFECLTHGVAFVDGLPAAHFHDISAVNGLQLELDTLYDESAALDTRVTAAEADIGTITSDMDAMDVRLVAAEADIDSVQADVVTLQTDVGNLQESSVSIGDVALLANIKEGIDLTAQVNGVLTTFAVGEAYVANSLRLFVNGSRQTRNVQYTEDAVNGTFTFIAGIVPTSPDNVTIDYIKAV